MRSVRFGAAALAALSIAFAMPALAAGSSSRQEATGELELIGHEPLFNRGMNAALAVHGTYAYVGSRTDGKPGNLNLTRGGIAVVDVSDPAAPRVVHEMGPPDEGNAGESSRELRVWRSQEILIVLHTNCGAGNAHLCQIPQVTNFRFYDISGANAANPKLIVQYQRNTHEFFLWEDPFDAERALVFGTGAGSQLQVWDVSPVAKTGAAPVEVFSASHGYTGGLHSMSVSNDGKLAYFALLSGGFAVVDVSEFTGGVPNPQLRRLTPNQNRPTWPGPGAHSAMKMWGQDYALVADEVYGEAAGSAHGCPWGWVRMIDISDPGKPVVRAEYKLPENEASFCQPGDTRPVTSFSAHNPTLTPNIGFVTWHSGGLQAIDLSDPAKPRQLAEFMPEPLPYVVTEDPRLSTGLEKVVMWSYPVIQDGLIYVVDLRNGLYILRYNGAFEDEVDAVTFLEGNSNQGHALCYEPVLDPEGEPIVPAFCDDRSGPGGPGTFTLVGHDPLLARGMNAALAVHNGHAYVGSRTDGKAGNANRAGIMVVDVSDPSDPEIVNEIPPPNSGNGGYTSREMRVWRSQDILIVQNLASNCSAAIHACSPQQLLLNDLFYFYDISGSKAADPKLLLTYDPPQNPHEFFLWEDPANPKRALMFVGPAGSSSLQVYDISPVRTGGQPTQVMNASSRVPSGGLHSLSVSNDGRRAYFAHLTGGFVVADVSDVTAGKPNPQLRLITPAGNRASWSGPGAHSAVKVWGRDWAFVADEVYGEALQALGDHGCPWGWVRMIDIADPTKPVVRAEYRLPQNEASFCETDVPRPFTSMSAHNPTLTPNIGFITWHSGGFQAIDLRNPGAPTQLAEFMPTPLPVVAQEDPVLSSGLDKVVMWSYPVIVDGLIYVVDVRNGLYVLRYNGPSEEEVDEITFLEGNSNQGHALCYEPGPAGTDAPAFCGD